MPGPFAVALDRSTGNVLWQSAPVTTGDGYYTTGRVKKDLSGAPYLNETTLNSQNADGVAVGKYFLYLHGKLPLKASIDTSGKALKCGGAFIVTQPSGPFFADPYGHPFVLDDAFVYGVVNGQLQRIPQ